MLGAITPRLVAALLSAALVAGQNCGAATSCSQCTSMTECGWCENDQKCSAGTYYGSSTDTKCQNGQTYNFYWVLQESSCTSTLDTYCSYNAYQTVSCVPGCAAFPQNCPPDIGKPVETAVNAISSLVTVILVLGYAGVGWTLCRAALPPVEAGFTALLRMGMLLVGTGLLTIFATLSYLAGILTLACGCVAVASLWPPAVLASIRAGQRVAMPELFHARGLAIGAIVLAALGVLVGAIYTPIIVEYAVPELDKARNGAPSRTLTWFITAFVASLPANLGCIAGCAAFLALYDRHVPTFTVPSGGGSAAAGGGGGGGVGLPPHMGAPTIVRIVTEAEAAQMRMAAQPPPTVGSVPGFDLVAVPRVGPGDTTGGLGFVSGGARQLYSSDGSSYAAPALLPFVPTPAATVAAAVAPAAAALLGGGGRRNLEYASLLQSDDPAANEAQMQKLSLNG